MTQGAGQDIKVLTDMARKMVTKFGMSDLGLLALEDREQPVFLGGESMQRAEYSEAIAARIDAQIRVIAVECYERAKTIIRDNRVAIDRLVDLLIERETIDGKEFRQLLTEYSALPKPQLDLSKQQLTPS